MNTAPALRIVVTRSKAAKAVGTNPRKIIAIVDVRSAICGMPSNMSIAGMSAVAPTSKSRAAIVIESMGGQRRVMMLEIA
mgnify:CR=1 FL=1